jgi:hypothetical protein
MRMPQTTSPSFATLCAAWCALVAISVVGRLWQPAANVTPLAGAAIVAGAVFPSPFVAATVPVAALMISNLVLPGYGGDASGWLMMAVVFACLTWPVLLGRLTRQGPSTSVTWGLIGSGLASSLCGRPALLPVEARRRRRLDAGARPRAGRPRRPRGRRAVDFGESRAGCLTVPGTSPE